MKILPFVAGCPPAGRAGSSRAGSRRLGMTGLSSFELLYRSSAAELRSLPPARVERPTDRASVAEREVDESTKPAVSARVLNRNPASRDRRAPIAIARGAASNLGVSRPPERARPYP